MGCKLFKRDELPLRTNVRMKGGAGFEKSAWDSFPEPPVWFNCHFHPNYESDILLSVIPYFYLEPVCIAAPGFIP